MKKIVMLVVVLVSILSGCGSNYSQGERVGIVTKLSEKGLIFKSYEGQMVLALPISVAGQTNPETFEFTADRSVVDKLNNAIYSGKRVKLIYRQWFLAPPTIDTDYVIYDVQPVDK